MVYFLGRDVSVVVTTESATANEKIGTKLKKAAALMMTMSVDESTLKK